MHQQVLALSISCQEHGYDHLVCVEQYAWARFLVYFAPMFRVPNTPSKRPKEDWISSAAPCPAFRHELADATPEPFQR